MTQPGEPSSAQHKVQGAKPELLSLAIGLFMFGIIVRTVAYFRDASLTGDEAMLALNIGQRSFTQLLTPLDYAQVAPVPFLWAERLLTQIAGVSEYTLRLLPLMAGVGLLWVTFRFADELSGRLEALAALALATSSFPLIRYSVEVKPYILDSLVCSLLIWMALHVLEDMGNRQRLARFGFCGAVGVLSSTPALLVSVAAAAAFTLAAVRRRMLGLVPWIALCGVFWGIAFTGPYLIWYKPVATSPYIRSFWAATFLQPDLPHFFSRLWQGLQDLSCTLTCWRGLFDSSHALLLFAVIGLAWVVRRRGPEYGVLLAGPILAAFGAATVGSYPIAIRLLLFSAPLVAMLVGAGGVAVAQLFERSWPRVRARWVLILLLYPSFILAAALTFAGSREGGIRGEEVKPLARLYRQSGKNEPVYVFPRAVPAWVFHTTDWSAPDTARLRWVAETAGPDGPGFVNGASRGRRSPGDGVELIYARAGWDELYGTPTGAQGRMGAGYSPPQPDSGWAESEVWRMRAAAKPYVWIVLSDYDHGQLNEREILMNAVTADGGEVVFVREAPGAVLYRVRLPPHPLE